MSDNMLKKEFRVRDVQRMRNLVTKNYSDKTTTQVGYTKKQENYQEGDVWEVDGKQWTIKNGIKQTITKFDKVRKIVSAPLLCPKCSQLMKNKLDTKMYPIHNMCFECVIKMETKLKLQGKFEQYQLDMNKRSLEYHLKEMENVLLELLIDQSEESFVTEAGDIETWKSNKSMNSTLTKDIQEYIQKIKDVLSS